MEFKNLSWLSPFCSDTFNKENLSVLKNLFTVLLIMPFIAVKGQANTGAYHCLGNGQYCVYEQGVAIKDLFGPPYSSPNYIQSYLKDTNIVVTSSREYGTAIWKHSLRRNGKIIAEVIDFVDSQLPVMVRKIKTIEPITFLVEIKNFPEVQTFVNTYDYQGAFSGALLIHKDRGLNIMQDYAHPFEQFHQILLKKNAVIKSTDKPGFFDVTVQPGESEIYFNGGPDYKDCIENSKKILSSNFEALYKRTQKYWDTYTNRRKDFNSLISSENINKKHILEQIDNVAVLLKTQQAKEGAVLAGQLYHMAYIRDQYGVSRGFLALGYYEEARLILDFYWKKWLQFGVLHNAQSIGIPGIFHIHENDEVEQTGYLIIQAFDYLSKTKDTQYIKTILPMLQWAWEMQKRNLVKNMLPFNGDETYVAGGLMPRTALNDGSAESTMLFIQSGRLLVQYFQDNNLLKPDSIRYNKQLLLNARAQYRDNFIKEGKLVANSPYRMNIAEMPLFRHGVCAGLHGIVWTQKDSSGNYLCPKCHAENIKYPSFERKTYFLPSIALAFVFIGSDLIPKEIERNINLIKKNYVESGSISSVKGSKTVIGYEYGLLLHALSKNKDSIGEKVFVDMLSVVDESGAWVEYYDDGKPKGCRYRPWESAINIEALVEYSATKNLDNVTKDSNYKLNK